MKIKRLSLEGSWYFIGPEELNRYQKTHTRIGSEGWYYDRASGISWVELDDGSAYVTSSDDFLFKLKLQSPVRLTPRERHAIQELCAMGSCPKELSARLSEDNYAIQLRNTVRGTKRFFLGRD
jgi:hypothetical protein